MRQCICMRKITILFFSLRSRLAFAECDLRMCMNTRMHGHVNVCMCVCMCVGIRGGSQRILCFLSLRTHLKLMSCTCTCIRAYVYTLIRAKRETREAEANVKVNAAKRGDPRLKKKLQARIMKNSMFHKRPCNRQVYRSP